MPAFAFHWSARVASGAIASRWELGGPMPNSTMVHRCRRRLGLRRSAQAGPAYQLVRSSISRLTGNRPVPRLGRARRAVRSAKVAGEADRDFRRGVTEVGEPLTLRHPSPPSPIASMAVLHCDYEHIVAVVSIVNDIGKFPQRRSSNVAPK